MRTDFSRVLYVTPIVAAILVLLMTGLGMRVTRLRRRLRVRFGDGGDPQLQTACRLHGNLVEHGTPLLVLLLIWELQGASKIAVATAGAAIVIARVLHAVGFSARLRRIHVAGAALTYTAEAMLSLAVFAKVLV